MSRRPSTLQDVCRGLALNPADGECIVHCRFDAIRANGGGAAAAAFSIDPVSCEGCGVCVRFCPEKAVDFHDLERLLSLTRHFSIPAAASVNRWDINPGMTERIEERACRAGARIAGGMGARAKELFAAQGVHVVAGATARTPESLATDYVSGVLRLEGNPCDH